MSKNRLFFLCLFCLSVHSFSVFAQCKDPIGQITFFDVGEGDSILVQSQGQSALIDTGNIVSGNAVLEGLKNLSINRLDKILLTHPHLDHIGGVFQVAQSIPFESIHDNGQSLEKSRHDTTRWYQEFIRGNSRYSSLKKGDTFQIGAFNIIVLSPLSQPVNNNWNANSLVLQIVSNEFKALLMGDATLETESALLEEKKDLKANLLKVGHHGAKDATSQEFLEKVSPKISVISVNNHHHHGYPDADVITRLKKYSSLYMTSQLGTITASVCKTGDIHITAKENAGDAQQRYTHP